MSNLVVFTSLFVAGEAFLAPRKQVPVAVPQKIGSPIEGATLKAKSTSAARFEKMLDAATPCGEGLEIDSLDDCQAASEEIASGRLTVRPENHNNPFGCSMHAKLPNTWYFSTNRNVQKVPDSRHMICKVDHDETVKRSRSIPIFPKKKSNPKPPVVDGKNTSMGPSKNDSSERRSQRAQRGNDREQDCWDESTANDCCELLLAGGKLAVECLECFVSCG
jgi:hypothetical protein